MHLFEEKGILIRVLFVREMSLSKGDYSATKELQLASAQNDSFQN